MESVCFAIKGQVKKWAPMHDLAHHSKNSLTRKVPRIHAGILDFVSHKVLLHGLGSIDLEQICTVISTEQIRSGIFFVGVHASDTISKAIFYLIVFDLAKQFSARIGNLLGIAGGNKILGTRNW